MIWSGGDWLAYFFGIALVISSVWLPLLVFLGRDKTAPKQETGC